MVQKKDTKDLINYKYALLAGLTGSAGAFFAKGGLTADNKLFRYCRKFPNGVYLSWAVRSFCFLMFCWLNIKMIEFKLRSFRVLGSSMTVIVAFISNYLFNLLYEIMVFNRYNFFIYKIDIQERIR